MPFSLEQFAKIRPYLYHVTSCSNLAAIRSTKKLICVFELTDECIHHPIEPRSLGESISFHGVSVELGDQIPLRRNRNQMSFKEGWNFEKFLRELNQRVFFFPGKPECLPSNCESFIKRKSENIVLTVLRTPTMLLINTNAKNPPQFCKYNSGAPRMWMGKKSERGPDTFVSEKDALFVPSEVKELAFLGSVELPSATQVQLADGWVDVW